MWCDFVAAGIGGRTIAEAKEVLSLNELRIWIEYRSRGLLTTARTHDIASATVARAFAGGKLSDFMRLKPVEEERPQGVSPAEAMRLLGGQIAKRKK